MENQNRYVAGRSATPLEKLLRSVEQYERETGKKLTILDTTEKVPSITNVHVLYLNGQIGSVNQNEVVNMIDPREAPVIPGGWI